jgi:hypothetical protein
MSKPTTLAIGILAGLALLWGAALASANRLALSNQTFRIVWAEPEPLTFGYPAIATVRCAVTMEGSFHSRTISKVSGAQIGYITRAIAAHPCEGAGEVWFLNGTERTENELTGQTLPWRILYTSFSGTLPNITAVKVNILGMSFLASTLDAFLSKRKCLYITLAERPAIGVFELNAALEVTNFRAEQLSSIPKHATLSLSIECPAIEWSRRGTATVLGAAARVTVTLVA